MQFSELHTLLFEGFKEKRNLWIRQGADPKDIDKIIGEFKELKLRNIITDNEDKDIDQYPTFDDLRRNVEHYRGVLFQHNRSKDILRKAKDGAKKIFENEKWKVYEITTYDASKLLGKGTKWCISATDGNGFNRFEEYKENNDIYFIISKIIKGQEDPKQNPPEYKYALLKHDKGFRLFDSQDNPISSNFYNQLFGDIPSEIFKFTINLLDLNRIVKGTYHVDKEGIVNVIGDVIINNADLNNPPWKFGVIDGSFDINGCFFKSFKSWVPHTVTKHFRCNDVRGISNFIGGPTEVGGNYFIKNCSIINCLGIPTIIQEDLYLLKNEVLYSLEGCPKQIYGNFECVGNKELDTLEGGPEVVGAHYTCSDNNLNTLKGGPKKCNAFVCSMNKLTTFDHIPDCRAFYGKSNPLTNPDAEYKKLLRLLSPQNIAI